MNLSFDSVLSVSPATIVSWMVGVVILRLTIARLLPKTKSEHTASTFERLLNSFQIWALKHPNAVFSRLVLPIITLVEGVMANFPTYLDAKRLALGSSFCCAGQVVIGDFNALKTALTSPQARTWRLGTSPLDAHFSPNLDVGGRNVFLLSLSDVGAGGAGDREVFRQALENYTLSAASKERQLDATALKLLDRLAADYAEMPHGPGDVFFTDNHRGWMGFLVRYIHYVMLGIDPADSATIEILTDLHYTRRGTVHYFAGIGRLFRWLNIRGHRHISQLIEQAATIYEQSPALADFPATPDGAEGMTRRELAKLLTAILSVAGLQGPLHLGYTAMGFRPLPAYKGQHTAEIDPVQYWDRLDLDDREGVRRFVLECARIWAPVSATHRVATEPFTTTISGQEQTFPAGTLVLIPMSLGLLDSSFWGPTTYEFDAQRENLCPYHMGFHSVGDRHAGRMCPGKDLALDMLVDVLISVGRVRRSLKVGSLVKTVR
ncbi:MAG: cytochrome 450 [Synechococcus sp.]